MKDLQFTGTINGTTVDITYRTDLINADAENFTVSQIMVGEEFQVSDYSDEDHVDLFNDFQRLPYNLKEFKDFATDNNITLTIKDSTGDNESTLIEADESVSESAS